jgi:hypothetical protein
MDFPENLYWGVLLKPVKKIQVRLKSNKNCKLPAGLRTFVTTLVTTVTMVVVDSNL